MDLPRTREGGAWRVPRVRIGSQVSAAASPERAERGGGVFAMNRKSVGRVLVALIVAVALVAGQAIVRPAAANHTVTIVTTEEGAGIITIVTNSERAITYRVDGGKWR